MNVTLGENEVRENTWDERFPVLRDGVDTGCKLVLGDLHGFGYRLAYPCGATIFLGDSRELILKNLSTHWRQTELAAATQEEIDVEDLYKEFDTETWM